MHAIAEEAASDTAAGLPGAAADLQSSPDEEDDWQFSEEIRTAADEDVEPDPDVSSGKLFDHGFDASALSGDEEAGDESLDLDSSFSGAPGLDTTERMDPAELSHSGLELDGDDPAAPPAAAPQDSPADLSAGEDMGVESGHDESSFGSVDDFTSWMEDEDAPAAAAPPAQAAEPAPSSSDPVEANEDPSSWDLAPDSDFGPPRSGAAASLAATISESERLAEAFGAEAGEGAESVAYADELSEPSAVGKWLGRAGQLAGWAIAIPVALYVAFLVVQSERARWQPAAKPFVAGALEAATTQSAWMETSRAGTLLIVDGEVRNTGAEVLWLEGLELELLDDAGVRMGAPTYSLGTPLPERTLRESAPQELDRAIEMAHKGLLAQPLAGGETRRFQAVVTELPEGARRILLSQSSAP